MASGPFELSETPGVNIVRVRANSLLWIKEPLINYRPVAAAAGLEICRLDRCGTWCSASRTGRPRRWHALQQYPVVQPWSECLDLGPNGELMETHRAFCRLVHEDQPVMQGPNARPGPYRFGHLAMPGPRRGDFLEATGGLLETAGLGAPTTTWRWG